MARGIALAMVWWAESHLVEPLQLRSFRRPVVVCRIKPSRRRHAAAPLARPTPILTTVAAGCEGTPSVCACVAGSSRAPQQDASGTRTREEEEEERPAPRLLLWRRGGTTGTGTGGRSGSRSGGGGRGGGGRRGRAGGGGGNGASSRAQRPIRLHRPAVRVVDLSWALAAASLPQPDRTSGPDALGTRGHSLALKVMPLLEWNASSSSITCASPRSAPPGGGHQWPSERAHAAVRGLTAASRREMARRRATRGASKAAKARSGG